MSRYIIDTKTWANLFEVQKVGVYGIGNDIVTDEKTVWSRTFSIDELEELNSDYINEHFSDLQDDAYNKGYAQCQDDYSDALKHAKDTAYQRGLNDAWEAAKRIFGYEIDGGIPINKVREVFGIEEKAIFCTADIIRDYTAQEAIDKIKAYEGKHSDRIEVGDEVKWEGVNFTVLRVFTPKGCYEQCDGFDSDGNGYTNILTKDVKKTGKHYDIQSILEAMKND